jgi:hypothetical protein
MTENKLADNCVLAEYPTYIRWRIYGEQECHSSENRELGVVAIFHLFTMTIWAIPFLFVGAAVAHSGLKSITIDGTV